jgi:hypothetical protein
MVRAVVDDGPGELIHIDIKKPRPVAKAFASVPHMPPRYDAGALLDELIRMNLFVVEMRDFVAMLVPAESASPSEPKAKQVTLGGKVSADFLERVRAFAASRGESMTSVTIAALTEHMGTA